MNMNIQTCPPSVQLSISLLATALCFVPLLFYKYKLASSKNRLMMPPGPTAFPIFGSLPQMLMNKPTFQWIHNLMQQLGTEIACIRLGSVHIIAVTSPELSREFLKKQDAVFASRPDTISSRLTSDGYLSLALSPAGNQWKKMRKVMVSEVLSMGVHQRFHSKRCEEADHLVRYVYNQCLKNGVVDVREAVRHYCGNVLRKLLFSERFFGSGMEDGGPGFEEREHIAGLFKIHSLLYGFTVADFVPWLEVFDFEGHKKIITNAINGVRKYHDPRVEKRIEMWQSGIKTEEDDILDLLINLKNSENKPLLSAQEITALILDIMLAAVDNSSNAVEWAMTEMMKEPDILAKAYEELDRVVGKGKLVQESDLAQLNYVKACLRESFRLHPIAPFNVPHASSKDTVVGGYFIPKGSYLVLSRIGLGQNPRIWDEPLKFKPERHMTADDHAVVLNDHELRMLSFSTGRRGCPAITLGSTMTTMLLARLLQCFCWKLKHATTNHLSLHAHATPRLDSEIYLQLMGI